MARTMTTKRVRWARLTDSAPQVKQARVNGYWVTVQPRPGAAGGWLVTVAYRGEYWNAYLDTKREAAAHGTRLARALPRGGA